MLSGVKLLTFRQIGDEKGYLVALEGDGADVPFDIKRIFYIYGSDSQVIRGKHANLKSEFVLINLAGKSKVKVIDENGQTLVVDLDKPHIGIYLPRMVWKEMYDFSEDSVLLCLSSEHYDPDEYVRDFDEYVSILRSKKQNDKEIS